MPKATPPPPERFEPITARWLTPGGPLPDPELQALDPDHRLPVELVEPIPPELEAPPPGVPAGSGPGRSRPGRAVLALWLVAAVLAAGAAGLVMGMREGYCPDPGECTVVYGGGPGGWLVAAGLVGLTVYAIRRAIRSRSPRGSAQSPDR